MKNEQALIEEFLSFLKFERGLSQSTVESYRLDLNQFLEYLISCKLNFQSISLLNVMRFFEFIVQTKKIEPSSQLRKISCLHGFYEFLMNNHNFSYNPLAEIQRPSKNDILPIFLEKDALHALMESAKTDRSKNGIRNYAILMLLYSSGMRISECLNLTMENIFDFNKKIKSSVIISGKGNRERIIFINKETRDVLYEYIEIRAFFSSATNKFLFNSKSKDGHVTRQNFYTSLKNMAYTAKINDETISPHKIRHTFATHLFLNGIDIRILQEMLGHADISTTQIYTHINSNSLKKVVESFHPLSKLPL